MFLWYCSLIEELHGVDVLAGGHDQLEVVGHQGRLEGFVPPALADQTGNIRLVPYVIKLFSSFMML
jgi:hypothetical protein